MLIDTQSTHIPQVSVIVIGRKATDFDEIKLHLSRQRFRDFELIVEVGGSIPQAWNRAVQKARGTYLVFTETDVRPLSEYWLEELVAQMNGADVVIKGLEVVGTPWNLCNTIIKREAFEQVQFDESYRWAEDTDLFCRLSNLGYRFERRETAAVFHQFSHYTQKSLKRAFHYGMYWMRIRQRYRHPIERASIRQLLLQVCVPVMQILGMLAGALAYLAERRFRREPNRLNRPLQPLPTLPKVSRHPGSSHINQPVKRGGKLKVLYISPFFPARSGIATYGTHFMMALERYAEGLEIKRFRDVRGRPCSPDQISGEIVALHQLLRTWIPDVIHIETGYGLLREFYLLLSLPKNRPYRTVVTVHDPPCLAGEPLRFIGDINASLDELPGVLGPELLRGKSFELEKNAFFNVDRMIVFSHKGKASLERQFGPHDGLHVLPHGVDIPPLALRPADKLPRVLFFGFLHPDKGVETLVEAMTMLPSHSVLFHMAGEPYMLTSNGQTANASYRDKLISKVEQAYFNQEVVVEGYVEDRQVDEIFAKADILVLPYHASSIASTSGVLLRGMAHGLAIVCSHVKALDELIRHEKTGLLVAPGDPSQLSNAIARLATDIELRQRLGREARAHVNATSNWPTAARAVRHVYE